MASSYLPDPDAPEPGNLRLLRRMVTALMAVMILGFIMIVAMFVIRLNDRPERDAMVLPDVITLPEGVKPQAFTVGRGWVAVVTDDDRILIFRCR
ncbi:DUF6476 family protein [Jhaorihella thermophila]